VGAHLVAWGVDEDRVTELDWWQTARVGDVHVVALPARHFSGRWRGGQNVTQWSSWAVIGPRHRVYFGGDTGLFPGFADIGRRFVSFVVTRLPIGAYDELWPDVHLTPEEALRAHELLRGRALL